MQRALAALFLGAALCAPAHATLLWNWRYDGDGVAAAGTFTTADAPDASGFYQITEIAGQRNGVAITALQRAGTSTPGNPGYPVDDLIRVVGPQLTKAGFGFALADGSYGDAFFLDSANPPQYLEAHSATQPPAFKEVTIRFSASIAPAPK
jgi:hypothetical protein